jgi:hypothetical protein
VLSLFLSLLVISPVCVVSIIAACTEFALMLERILKTKKVPTFRAVLVDDLLGIILKRLADHIIFIKVATLQLVLCSIKYRQASSSLKVGLDILDPVIPMLCHDKL